MGRIPDGKKFTTPILGKNDHRSEHPDGMRQGNPRRASTLIGWGLTVAVMAVFVYAIWGRQLSGG